MNVPVHFGVRGGGQHQVRQETGFILIAALINHILKLCDELPSPLLAKLLSQILFADVKQFESLFARVDHSGQVKTITVQKYRFSAARVGVAVGTQEEAIALGGRNFGKRESRFARSPDPRQRAFV